MKPPPFDRLRPRRGRIFDPFGGYCFCARPEGKRVSGGKGGGKGCQVPFPLRPLCRKKCRPYGSENCRPGRLRNSDWKAECGTRHALKRVPDTVFPQSLSQLYVRRAPRNPSPRGQFPRGIPEAARRTRHCLRRAVRVGLKRIVPPLQGSGICLGPVDPGLQPGLC